MQEFMIYLDQYFRTIKDLGGEGGFFVLIF
jgi:hypothetical protein